MLLTVFGGTGTAGSAVVREALSRGYKVRAVSRSGELPPGAEGAEAWRADAATGEGVIEALVGADVLVDSLNAISGEALQQMPNISQQLFTAAGTAGVRHRVLLSILNCERSSYSYYQVQAARAQVFAQGGSVVYATQFHDLLGSIFSAVPGIIPRIAGVYFQPVSVPTVAQAIVDAAETGAPVTKVAGPEILSMVTLANQWQSMYGGMRLKLCVPGKFGQWLRTGGLVDPAAATDGETFLEWAEAQWKKEFPLNQQERSVS